MVRIACFSQRGSLDGVDITKFNRCLIGWMDFASAPSSLSLPARRGSEPLVSERMSLPEPRPSLRGQRTAPTGSGFPAPAPSSCGLGETEPNRRAKPPASRPSLSVTVRAAPAGPRSRWHRGPPRLLLPSWEADQVADEVVRRPDTFLPRSNVSARGWGWGPGDSDADEVAGRRQPRRVRPGRPESKRACRPV